MELVIPDGAQVYITVGQPPLLALPHQPHAVAPQYPPQPERSGGRIVKTLLAGVVLLGAFQAGRLLPHQPDTAAAAQPTTAHLTAAAAPGATESSAAGEIPQAFRAQVAQPPQVIPPPGAPPAAGGSATGGSGRSAAPAAAPAPASPFGLQGG
jgi:hypothetical protein